MNMQAMMQQAQRLQREITKKKEELEKQEFIGTSEWVEAKYNGKKELISIKITYDFENTTEDKEMLEDMILLASKDALRKIDAATEKTLGQYASLNGLI